MTQRKQLIWVISAIIILCLSTIANAAVLKGISRDIKTKGNPLDIAVSADGKKTFVLIEGGIVQVFGVNGRSQGIIEVSKSVVAIEASPNGEILLMADKDSSLMKAVSLDYIIDINIKGSPFKGPADAPVVIAEFSDFECPYCAQAQPLLEQVLKQYPNEVKLVYKNFPIARIHKFAHKAAVAALAAGEQDNFWEYHDLLFEDFKNINDARITEIATKLGLDMDKFYQDMTKPEFTKLVNDDYQEGVKIGVRGTPTIYINGRLLKQRSLDGFMKMIDDELKKMGNKKEQTSD